jgi:hypothetical protein
MCTSGVKSNLGGLGPDFDEPEEIRYYNVETGIDLVVTNLTTYTANYAGRNGKNGCFGTLNLLTIPYENNSVLLKYSLMKTGTNDLADNVGDVHFTIFDVDQGTSTLETVTFYDRVETVYTDANCELEQSGSLETGLTFHSTTKGVGNDNPHDPMAMTGQQMDRSVTVQYTDKSWWTLTFTTESSKEGGGRNLLFAGKSALVPAKATTTTTTLGGGEQSISGSACVIWGDPHIITFDVHSKRVAKHPNREAFFRTRDWKMDELSVYEAGTFWLVKSDLVHIQGTYIKNLTHPNQTSLGAVAIGGPFLNKNVLTFRPLSENVTWNEQPILSTFPSEFHNSVVLAKYHAESELVKDGKRGQGIDVTLPQGVQLTVNRWNQSLALKIHMGARQEGQDGQCGNYNGDANDDTKEFLFETNRVM